MSFNIVDLVKDQISDQVMGSLSSALGTEPAQTSSALSGALPGLLSGLMQSASTPSGAGALFDSVQKQDDGFLGNMGNLLGGNNATNVASQGTSVLTSLLGDGALGSLAGLVAKFAGVGGGKSSSLIGMLAPIVFSVIKKKIAGGGLNASSLASMLSGQKDNINAAMPQGFSDQLESSGFMDSIKAVQSPAARPQPTQSTQAQPAQSSSMFKWLLPVAGLLVVGWLAMQFLGGDKVDDAIDSTKALSADALQDVMPDGVDFGELSTNLDGVFSSTSESLSGITDLDSAREALPAIEEATGKLGGLNDVISGLPDAAKGPIGSIVQTGLAALKPILDKVSAIPGVGDIINPVIGPMITMLEGLAG